MACMHRTLHARIFEFCSAAAEAQQDHVQDSIREQGWDTQRMEGSKGVGKLTVQLH